MTPELLGPSVRLRTPVRADYPLLFDWFSDPEIVAPFDRYETDTLESFVAAVEAAPSDPRSLSPRFVVERRETPGPVGIVGHYEAHPVLEYVDLWYVIADPSVRGKGVGREAVGLLVDHLFATLRVERLGATCDVENAASYRLVEGLGFRREGTLASALFHHGRWHDVHVYGITRAGWRARRPPG